MPSSSPVSEEPRTLIKAPFSLTLLPKLFSASLADRHSPNPNEAQKTLMLFLSLHVK